MIVDFQHHFTPRELMPKDLGRRKLVSYDEHGAPSFIMRICSSRSNSIQCMMKLGAPCSS